MVHTVTGPATCRVTACVPGLGRGLPELFRRRGRDVRGPAAASEPSRHLVRLRLPCPLDKFPAYRARKGWTVPWYSAYGSDFNYDFHLSLDESVAPLEYNYRNRTEYEEMAVGWLLESEQPVDLHGHSCFLRDGDRFFHTYYARGAETVGGSYYFLDLRPSAGRRNGRSRRAAPPPRARRPLTSPGSHHLFSRWSPPPRDCGPSMLVSATGRRYGSSDLTT